MRKAAEMQLMNEIRLYLSENDVISFRTNVGKVEMRDGRWFDTGLPKGFSDLLCLLPGGRACFIEVKVRPNRPTKEQLNFIDRMKGQGAAAGVCYSLEDVGRLLDGGRKNGNEIEIQEDPQCLNSKK